MNATCPNCGTEFAEHRETAYLCEQCGWLNELDGKWVPCPEPAKPADVSPPAEPKPKENVPASPPVPAEPAEPEVSEHSSNGDRPSNVRSHLWGLVTVTEQEEDDDGNS